MKADRLTRGPVVALIGLAMYAGISWAEDPKVSPAAAALEKLKGLTGEWVDAKGTQPGVQASYRVISGGSTVMETLFPGTPHEMVTMYHLDGANLVLTHYCAAGNQPEMKFVPGSDPNILKFDFTGGSNIDPNGMYMHDASIDLSSPNVIKAAWTAYQGGKAQEPHKIEIVRKTP